MYQDVNELSRRPRVCRRKQARAPQSIGNILGVEMWGHKCCALRECAHKGVFGFVCYLINDEA